MTELHSFAEAIAYIESGGCVHRYGGFFPLYYHGQYSKLARRTFSCQEYIEDNLFGPSVNFSLEETKASDWVFVPRDVLNEHDRSIREFYNKQAKDNFLRQAATGVYEGSNGQYVPPVPPRWPRWLVPHRWFAYDAACECFEASLQKAVKKMNEEDAKAKETTI